MTGRPLLLLTALAGGAVVLVLLAVCEQHRSAAQIACAAIKTEYEKQGDSAEDDLRLAFETCHDRGLIRLPGD